MSRIRSASRKTILEAVCLVLDVNHDIVRGKQRDRALVRARQYYMYISHVDFKLTLKSVGAYLDRDHSTIVHGVRAIQNELEEYEDARLIMQECRVMIDRLVSRRQSMSSRYMTASVPIDCVAMFAVALVVESHRESIEKLITQSSNRITS